MRLIFILQSNQAEFTLTKLSHPKSTLKSEFKAAVFDLS